MTASTDGWSVWPAPAKINLFLHVLGRRADGYHNIHTLYQLLDWSDQVRVRLRSDAQVRRRAASYAVAAADDLVVRAARRLQEAAGSRQGADLEVVKQIPLGAGLGGGSSDAATALLALNRLWGCGLDRTELTGLAAGLGADVPVFVHGHSALAGGIGEQLEAVSLGCRHYVLVLPGLAISTAEVFAHPDLRRDSQVLPRAEALRGGGRNDCEAVVRSCYPQMAVLLDDLRRWGRPRMTGTGSAVFLPMTSAEAAIATAQQLKSRYNVRALSGLDRSPLLDRLDAEGP